MSPRQAARRSCCGLAGCAAARAVGGRVGYEVSPDERLIYVFLFSHWTLGPRCVCCVHERVHVEVERRGGVESSGGSARSAPMHRGRLGSYAAAPVARAARARRPARPPQSSSRSPTPARRRTRGSRPSGARPSLWRDALWTRRRRETRTRPIPLLLFATDRWPTGRETIVRTARYLALAGASSAPRRGASSCL